MTKLFIENQPHELFHTDGTAILYEERCLPSANANDIVVTSLPIEKDYITYLREMGLILGCEFITPHALMEDLATSILNDDMLLALLKERTFKENYVIETFIANENQTRLAEYLNTPLLFNQTVYDNFASKLGFRKLADHLELPVPDSLIISQENSYNCNLFIKKDKTVLLKRNNSIGGSGVYDASSETVIQEIMNQCPSELFILEDKIDAAWNGSIQFLFLNDNYRIFIDECITDNISFRGFKYPPSFPSDCLFNVGAYADKIATYLKQYYKDQGCCGIDFIIDKNNNLFFHDCNPRKTGVMYVLAFIEKLIGNIDINRLKIISKFINLEPINGKRRLDFSNIMNLLRRNKLLFEQLDPLEGVLLFNPSLLSINILHVISLSRKYCESMYLEQANKLISTIF